MCCLSSVGGALRCTHHLKEHGTVTLNDDGSFVYRPDPDFNREDSFQYVANDGTADSNVATVTITAKTDYPWHNGVEPLNVSDDKYCDGFKEVDNITPFEALLVINFLNSGEGEGESVLEAQTSVMLAAPLESVSTSLSSSRKAVSHATGVVKEPVLPPTFLTGMPITRSLSDTQVWDGDETEWTQEDLEEILGERVTGQVDL